MADRHDGIVQSDEDFKGLDGGGTTPGAAEEVPPVLVPTNRSQAGRAERIKSFMFSGFSKLSTHRRVLTSNPARVGTALKFRRRFGPGEWLGAKGWAGGLNSRGLADVRDMQESKQ